MLTTLVATTRVAFTGAVNKQMTFGLSSSEYVIKHIDGLGPVKATITSADNATDAGSTFLYARDGQRNIVITFGFAPTYSTGSTQESLRLALGQVFTPKTLVELTFTNDVLGTFNISGRVESNEPSIFSREPEVVISIICDDPYFYSTAADTVFNIPLLVPGAEEFSIDYLSDVPVGFVFEFDRDADATISDNFVELKLLPSIPPMSPVMELLNFPFETGDAFRISSVRGDRGAIYVRDTLTHNAMPWFTGSLANMLLQPGLNYFSLGPTFSVTGQSAKNAKITYQNIRGSL
jgi:hypothetical protein